MIHILLLILKIIGIVLLVILGLLSGLLAAVLFIPVRYKAAGSYHGQLLLSVRVTWFLHLISFGAVYEGRELVCSLKILGFRLWKKRDKDAARDLEDGLETILGDEEQTLYEELQQDEQQYRKDQETPQKPETGNHVNSSAGDGESGPKETGEQEPAGKSSGFFGRFISRLYGLPGRLAQKIRHILEKLKFSFEKLCDKLKGISEFIQEKKMWLEDEKNQASVRLLYRQTRSLLVHMWPRKGRCSVTFGFDDPYTTGQVLQAASLIYPFYHKQLSLYPMFDEKVLDAEGSVKGRIRLGVVLWLVLRVLFDGHTRRMLRGFLK